MGSSILRKSDHLATLMRTNIFRSCAPLSPSDGSSPKSPFFLPSWTPHRVPVATRYMRGRRRWKFLPKLIGEEHVQPDVHVRHNFEQRLKAIQRVDEEIHRVHDIGLPVVVFPARRLEKDKEMRDFRRKIRDDFEMERDSRLQRSTFDAAEVEHEDGWEVDDEDSKVARSRIEHCGVFRDLFGSYAVFRDAFRLDIGYDVESPGEDGLMAPVYYGNFVDASHCQRSPAVQIERVDEEFLWTLLMTSPDQNLAQSNAEILHWMVGNIRGSDASTGQVVVPYMPPFPMRGFGPLRYVFIAYKQEAPLDFSALTSVLFDDSRALAQRGFSTYSFYRRHQDVFTPTALRFFQCHHEDCVTDFFRNRLEMKEPSYAYDWPEPVRPLQAKTEERTSFNEYLDLFRDRKEINEQVLKKRLSMGSPFEGYPPRDAWPNALVDIVDENPTWLSDELSEQKLRRGKWRDLEIRD